MVNARWSKHEMTRGQNIRRLALVGGGHFHRVVNRRPVVNIYEFSMPMNVDYVCVLSEMTVY